MSDPTKTQMSSLNDDEIDLRELFGVLWRGKIVIMLCVIAAIPANVDHKHWVY